MAIILITSTKVIYLWWVDSNVSQNQSRNGTRSELEAAGAAERAADGLLPKLAEIKLQKKTDEQYFTVTAPKKAIDNFPDVTEGSSADVHVDFQSGMIVYDFGGGLE